MHITHCNTTKRARRLPLCDFQDIDDLQNFACKHKVDFVAASFVQSKEDVLFIRKTLDDAGGQDIKIISKIENMAGLENFDGACVAGPAICGWPYAVNCLSVPNHTDAAHRILHVNYTDTPLFPSCMLLE